MRLAQPFRKVARFIGNEWENSPPMGKANMVICGPVLTLALGIWAYQWATAPLSATKVLYDHVNDLREGRVESSIGEGETVPGIFRLDRV